MLKRGESLPLNVIIIGILVVLVLVSVAVFYFFTWGKTTSTIKRTFSNIVAGDDRGLATQLCSKWCEDAKLLSFNERKNSAYCGKSFNVDDDLDGEAEKDGNGKYYNYYCYYDAVNYNEDRDRHLGVSCFISAEEKNICE